MKILTRKTLTRLLSISMIALLSVSLIPSAFAATETETVAAPDGDEDYTFTQRIHVTENTPFAGVQIKLTVSDPDALVLNSYSRKGSDVESAVGVSPVYRNGVYTFGFTAGSNAFSGELDVGEISFTYSGSEEATFTITSIKISYFPNDGKTSAWLREETDYATINVSRSGEDGIMSIEIGDHELPLASGLAGRNSWALLNLIMSVAGIGLAAATGIRVLKAQNRRKGIDAKESGETESGTAQGRRKLALIVSSIALGIGGVILFLLTQDMSKPMVLADIWAVASVLAFAAELMFYILAFRRGKDSDSDDSGIQPTATEAT